MQLNTEDAAQLADVRQVTIRQNIRRGNLKAEKRGRDWAIEWTDFEVWAVNRGVKLSPLAEIVRREDGAMLLIVGGELALVVSRAAERQNLTPQQWFDEVIKKELAKDE